MKNGLSKAVYKPHWSLLFHRYKSGTQSLGHWAHNEIDEFVMIKMKSHGLKPNEESDKERLLKKTESRSDRIAPSVVLQDQIFKWSITQCLWKNSGYLIGQSALWRKKWRSPGSMLHAMQQSRLSGRWSANHVALEIGWSMTMPTIPMINLWHINWRVIWSRMQPKKPAGYRFQS